MEILTTLTFDTLFKRLPSGVQAKALKKTDLFKENPFHSSLIIEKLHPKNLISGLSELISNIGSSLNFSEKITPFFYLSAIIMKSMTMTSSNSLI
jgi:hypothetical protein